MTSRFIGPHPVLGASINHNSKIRGNGLPFRHLMVPIRTGHESIGRGNDIIHKKVHRLSLLTECFSKGKPGSRRIPISRYG